jgi:pimeloyl-ACP methyl ester carboxylesterase
MSRTSKFCPAFIASGLSMAFALFPLASDAGSTGATITERTAETDGVRLHYLTAGHDPTVILLHGYAETSHVATDRAFAGGEIYGHRARFAGHWRVIDSRDGLDMKTSATRIHALARSLGVEKARVVGHDIGLMVAYAYAAQFPAETEKLVLMDAFLPGVPGWEAIYNDPGIWHFRFNGEYPEALVKGR